MTFREFFSSPTLIPTVIKFMISLLRPSWERKEQDSALKAPTTLSLHQTHTRMQSAKLCLPVSLSWNETPAPNMRRRYLQMFCSSALSAILTARYQKSSFYKMPLLSEMYGCLGVSSKYYLYLVHSKFGLPLLNLPPWHFFIFLSRHVNDVQFIQICLYGQ